MAADIIYNSSNIELKTNGILRYTLNAFNVEKIIREDLTEVLIPNTEAGLITLHTELSTNFFFKAPSNGGGGSVSWGSITNDINNQTDLPFTVENTVDARFKGDVYASGDFFAQQNSTVYANNIKVGVTGDKLVITNQETEKQSLVALNEIDSKVSTGTKDIFRYDAFAKTDPIGQGQPDDSLTFNSTSFTEDLTGQTKYFFQVTTTIANQLVTDTWFPSHDHPVFVVQYFVSCCPVSVEKSTVP